MRKAPQTCRRCRRAVASRGLCADCKPQRKTGRALALIAREAAPSSAFRRAKRARGGPSQRDQAFR